MIKCFCLMAVAVSATLNVEMWQSNSNYPTDADFPESQYLASKPSTAIAFTGGGARAYLGAMGQLAGLHKLDLMKNIRYIGGISGGAWATTTFSFAQNVEDDTQFLGEVVMPGDLSVAGLQEMDPKCARSLAIGDLTFIGLKAWNQSIVDSIPACWAYGVQKVYLEPVGITEKTRFSWNEQSVADIKKRNPALADEKFLLPTNGDRPYPVIGATLVGPTEGAPYTVDTQNFTMLEFTPLYVGQMKNLDVTYMYNLTGRSHVIRVGGAVESFGFPLVGSAPKVGLGAGVSSAIVSMPEPTEVLDLQYAAGAASYAPGTVFESLRSVLPQKLGLSMNYFSPSDKLPSSKKWLFGDGGSYENIPLINFLQRRVKKIVLFFNSEAPLQPASKWDVDNDAPAGQVTDSLSMFFGVLPPYHPQELRAYRLEKNQVFAKEEFSRVIKGLQAAQEVGRGNIFTAELVTIANEWWGVPAGVAAEVTFVCLGRSSKWEGQLTDEMRSLLVPSDPEAQADMSQVVKEGPFRSFPHYATTGGLVNYERANALADLTGWTILENAELFKTIFA